MADRVELEIKGPLMQVERFGVMIGDKECSYSKSYRKERFGEEHVGQMVRVKLHNHQGTLYIMDVLEPVMAKAANESAAGAVTKGSNPRGGSWNGRGRMSAEEVQLEKEKGERIARSNALQSAIQSSQAGSSVEEILKKAQPFAQFIQQGVQSSSPTGANASGAKAATEPPTAKAAVAATTGHDTAPPRSDAAEAPDKTAAVRKLPPTVKAAGDARVPDAVVTALWNRAKERRWSWTQFENVCRRATGGKVPRILTFAEFQKFSMEVDAALKAA